MALHPTYRFSGIGRLVGGLLVGALLDEPESSRELSAEFAGRQSICRYG
jgi:hypothetical protein